VLRRTILILCVVALVAPLAAFADEDEQIVVVVPTDMTIEATGPQGAIVTFTARAHRGTSQLTVTCVPASGSTFAIRRTTVDCSATDQGETGHATFHITVQDTTGPVVTVPAGMNVDATSSQGAVVTFSASANDLVDGPRPVTCAPPSATLFPIGNTRVTCRSSDTRNNTGSASFNIHVADPTQRPVLTMPSNMLVEAQNSSGAAVTYGVSAVDHLGRPIPVTCAPPSGSQFGFGETTVSCGATDLGNGESVTKSFKITVVDHTPPAITVPATRLVTARSRAGIIVRYSATAVDRVDGPVAVTCAPASGSHFVVGTTTVTCTAVDRHNNASSASFVVIVAFSTRSIQAAAMLSPAAGARISAPPLLRWRAARKATFYNVQVFRDGQKVLSVWPSRPWFRLRGGWTFNGQRYRLRPGSYTWIVWPAYGSPSRPRFGRVLGLSSFVFVKRTA
jgi:hypothetical protein